MMVHMTSPAGFIVCLTDVALEALVGPVEVLVQEGLSTFSLPIGSAAFSDLTAIYGMRASFGAHAITTTDDIEAAAAAGASFLLADVAAPELAEAAARVRLPIWLPAMTPTEVRAVLQLPVEGALLFPADVVGHAMAAHLGRLGLAEKCIPVGGVGAFSAEEWFKAGGQAVCVDETLLGNALSGGDLAQLRDRCGSFLSVLNKRRQGGSRRSRQP